MKERKAVLLLDDDPIPRDTIEEAFLRSPEYRFEVHTASDPLDYLLKNMRERPFDVAVLDLSLTGPRKKSFACLRKIAAWVSQNPEALIVVYSGYPQPENVVRSIKLGADEFLDKTECDPDQLAQRVVAMLREHARARR